MQSSVRIIKLSNIKSIRQGHRTPTKKLHSSLIIGWAFLLLGSKRKMKSRYQSSSDRLSSSMGVGVLFAGLAIQITNFGSILPIVSVAFSSTLLRPGNIMESSRPDHALMSAQTESFILNNKVFSGI